MLHDLIVASTLRQQMLNPNSPPIFAGWLQSGDWRTARVLAYSHSLVVIDAEHGAIDLNQIALCIEVMAGNNCLAIVRIPYTSDSRNAFARRCLDAGAIGILSPNICSKEAAIEFIQNCYYPSEEMPWGKRGFGYGGCNQDGAKFKEYAAVANDRIVIGCQLENRQAFASTEILNEILTSPGLVFTQDGPYDHSGSYLCPGETSDPRVLEDLSKYREACKRNLIVSGKHVVIPTAMNIKAAVNDGYKFIALGTDMLHIDQGVKSVLKVVEEHLQGQQDEK